MIIPESKEYNSVINNHVMENGNVLYWIGESMVKVTNNGYICYENNRHCFKRRTHEIIINKLGIQEMVNLTFKEYYRE